MTPTVTRGTDSIAIHTRADGILLGLGVAEDRIYLDHGLTGTNRQRPGLDQALAAYAPETPSCQLHKRGAQ